jgi:hypothetical protein
MRLSNIERGHSEATEEGSRWLANPLEQLIAAKTAIQRVAAAVGWPLGEAG